MTRVKRSDHVARQRRNDEWRLLRKFGFSYPEIGELYGVDHTTVLYAVNEEFANTKREQMRFRHYLNTADLEASE